MSPKSGYWKRVTIALCSLLITSAVRAESENYAPILSLGKESTLLARRTHAFGPFFELDEDGSSSTTALRPLWVDNCDSTTDSGWQCSLYPFFANRYYPGGNRFSIFELIVASESVSETGKPIETFEIWPFYWHYNNGVPEESYDAVMPIAGTLRNRLFFQRIDWFAFPAFLRLQQYDHTDTCLLWPIFRHRTGKTASGWAVWPLYGHFEDEERYDNTFALWPLFYDNHKKLRPNQGGGTLNTFGALPFYASESAPGLDSKTWLWPFFGYTTESAPRPDYHEVRLLYPFIVVGDGEKCRVRRFLPLYADQRQADKHKKWILWPIYKIEDKRVDTVDVHKETVLYFLVKNEVQTAPGHEDFRARKLQLWPLFGYLNDGQDKCQVQILNPFEPLLGGNEMIRQNWTALFSIYRYERSGDELRHSLLWDLILYDREGTHSKFSIGPLFDKQKATDASSWRVLKGLIGREKTADGTHWSALWGLIGKTGKAKEK